MCGMRNKGSVTMRFEIISNFAQTSSRNRVNMESKKSWLQVDFEQHRTAIEPIPGWRRVDIE